MTGPFVDQLAGLCRAHPTRAKWVFVPTHAVGRTLGDRLVLEGMATVYEEAVKHLDWCPIQAQDCWTELSATAWTPLQRQLLGRCRANV